MTITELIRRLQSLKAECKKNVRVALVTEEPGNFCFDLYPQVDLIEYPLDGDDMSKTELVVGIATHHIMLGQGPEENSPRLRLVKSKEE